VGDLRRDRKDIECEECHKLFRDDRIERHLFLRHGIQPQSPQKHRSALPSILRQPASVAHLDISPVPVEKLAFVLLRPGKFEFTEQILTLDELHQIALANRPDLKAAMQAVDKAKTDYRLAVANGATDPTFGMDLARNPPIPAYIGFSVTVPLRIFDRNQGEKARTQLDIRRNERLQEANEAQVFSDADSAFATLNSNRVLLRAYKAKYLDQATRVRDTVSFSYQHGGASLLDFLNAQNDYRSVQLNYLNLVGSYMTAASQLNMAVGSEVIK